MFDSTDRAAIVTGGAAIPLSGNMHRAHERVSAVHPGRCSRGAIDATSCHSGPLGRSGADHRRQRAGAEKYPDRPIRLIVPFAAGGTSDLMGRVVGARLGEASARPSSLTIAAGRRHDRRCLTPRRPLTATRCCCLTSVSRSTKRSIRKNSTTRSRISRRSRCSANAQRGRRDECVPAKSLQD